jgi:hypothetical protein
MPRWIEAHASRLQSLHFTSAVALLKRCLVDGPDRPMITGINQVNGYSTGSSYIYCTRSPYIFESNVNTEENIDVDDVDQSSVSSSDLGYQEIQGFFDSKVLNTGTTTSKDNVKSNTEESIPRLTRHCLHKLAEVSEEDEVEDSADPPLQFPSDPTRVAAVVEKVCPVFTDGRTKNNDLDLLSKAKNQEFQAIADDGTCLETIGRSFFTNQRGFKMGKNVPSADGTNADPSAIKLMLQSVIDWSEKGLEKSMLLKLLNT